MKFNNLKGHDIPEAKLHLAFQTAVSATLMLNNITIPAKPEDYISQYQVDIITMTLGIDPIVLSEKVSAENQYPIYMEFSTAMEGCRAGLFKLNELAEEF